MRMANKIMTYVPCSKSLFVSLLYLFVCLLFVSCDDAQSKTENSTAKELSNSVLTLDDCKNSDRYSCISIMNSGQGNCVAISCKGGEKIVNDCGGSSDKAGEIKAYFKAIGVHNKDQLKAVVVSHPHADHYDLLPLVLAKNDLHGGSTPKDRYFIDVAQKSDYTKGNFGGWYADMIEAADAPLEHEFIKSNHYDPIGTPHDQLGCKTGTPGEGLYILAGNVSKDFPADEYHDDPASPCSDEGDDGPLNSPVNDQSIVLKFHRNAFGMTLPGDAGRRVEAKILSRYPSTGTNDFLNLDAHLLSHHGSCRGVNSPDWVLRTSPGVIVTSAAKNNVYSHPRCLATSLYAAKLVPAASHDVGCYTGRGKYEDPIPKKTIASFNTLQSEMVVLRIDETNDTYDVWTCPKNTISASCEKGVPSP